MAEYNIVTAIFSGCNPRKAVAIPVSWQWDTGQVLKIVGLDIPNGTQAHFNADGDAITQLIGVVNGVGYVYIPDVFLQTPGTSNVYIYISEDDATAETEYVVQIKVLERVRPEDYSTPTEAEETLFQAAIDAVRESAEDAEDAADLAESWAVGGTETREGEDTDNAKYYSEEARDAEAGAADSAAEALASETAAAGSASTAAAASTSAAEAKTAAETAQAAATAKATEAANSASAAGVSAGAASASETAAGAYASTAGASAVSAANSASAAESSATSAASSASSAESSATAAAEALVDVTEAKQDALTAISGAQTTAVGAVTAEGTTQVAAVTAEGTAQKAAVQAKGAEVIASIPSDYSELSADVSSLKSDKADKTGTYSTLTAGNLATEDGSNNSTPYLFRASGGGVKVGEREYDKIVGGTVAWNQLAQAEAKTASASWSEDTSIYFKALVSDLSIPIDSTHVYFLSAKITRTISTNNGIKLLLYINGASSGLAISCANGAADGYFANVGKSNASGVAHSIVANNYVYKRAFNAGDTLSYDDYFIIDLTQMFGTTIADYLYTLESGTAGAGVAKLKEWGFFSAPYYPYNAGELKSVEGLTSHEMVGFNQWDEEWEPGAISTSTGEPTTSSTTIRSKNFCPCLPNVSYYGCGVNSPSSFAVFFYDANHSYVNFLATSAVRNNVFTTPSNARYFKLYFTSTTYNHDICINLSDPAKNGSYEPYVKHSYPLDDSLTLRGIPKLDSNNQLYYDGDTYESDGTVTRRYGVVDLGTLTWTRASGKTDVFYASVLSKKLGTASSPMVCSQYVFHGSVWDSMSDNSVAGNSSYALIYIKDSRYSDAATFKTAMSGVYLVYVLATSTAETAEPFASPQIVDQYGTEEYVTTGIVPVGHETFYPENLRQKIEGLPWNFASLIAPTEVTYKATQNYTSGSLFIVNNVLYKATANIANGGTITPGTNCTPTTLAAVIAAL